MNIELADFYGLICQQYFSPEDRLQVQKSVADLSEEQFQMIQKLDYKSPAVTLAYACSLGWFGVDRFYLNQTLVGVIKIIVFVAAFFGNCSGSSVAALIPTLIGFVLVLVDIITALKRTYDYNDQQFNERLDYIRKNS